MVLCLMKDGSFCGGESNKIGLGGLEGCILACWNSDFRDDTSSGVLFEPVRGSFFALFGTEAV